MATIGNLLADEFEVGSDCPLEMPDAGVSVGAGEEVVDDIEEVAVTNTVT